MIFNGCVKKQPQIVVTPIDGDDVRFEAINNKDYICFSDFYWNNIVARKLDMSIKK